MKKNINPIPKSFRERKRYILLDTKSDYRKEITSTITYLYGIIFFSKMRVSFVKPNCIKVRREYKDKVLSAINYFNLSQEDKIYVKKISGTLDGLYE